MDWSWSTYWWIATGVLIAAELASGTFYLLMLALGGAAGALAAHLGMGLPGQMLVAAIVGGAATVAWYLRRRSRGEPAPAASNPDVNLDIGQTVHVHSWSDEGTAQVQYRGAAWSARYIGQAPAASGPHVIRAIEGSRLLLDR